MKIVGKTLLWAGAIVFFSAAPQAHAQSDDDNRARIAAEIEAVTLAPVRARAQAGDVAAQAQLGAGYFNAKYYLSQYQAFRWLSLAAMAGRSDSQVLLAQLYDRGIGVTRDRGLALDWYEKAATQGERAGQEQLCLAYITGEGRAQDGVKGRDLCRKASLQLSDMGFYGLALSEELGTGTPADAAQARSDYHVAATYGNADAMDALGRIALSGPTPDYVQAHDWFHKAIALGSVSAVDHMAQLYETGHGSTVDMMAAARLYTHAAMYGNAHAQAWMTANPKPVAAMPPPLEISKLPHLFANVVHPAPPAPGQAPGATVTEDLWDYFQQISDAYPDAALDDDVEGESIISCHVSPALKLVDCLSAKETPEGYGFNAAIIHFLDRDITLHVDTDDYGQPVANRDIQILFKWEL